MKTDLVPVVKHFEHVTSGVGQRTGVLLCQFQVILGHFPDGWTFPSKQSRIMKVTLYKIGKALSKLKIAVLF